MSSSSPQVPPVPDSQRVLDQFHSFPFSSDDAFQQGLSGILAHAEGLTEHARSALVLQTQLFYFNRVTGHQVRLADVVPAPARRGAAGSEDGIVAVVPGESGNERELDRTCMWGGATDHGETHTDASTLTFAELKRLIEEGKTDEIPNNKTIPDVLNDGVPSTSSALPRKKPWEDTNRS